MDKYYLKNARKRCFLPAGVFYPPRLYAAFVKEDVMSMEMSFEVYVPEADTDVDVCAADVRHGQQGMSDGLQCLRKVDMCVVDYAWPANLFLLAATCAVSWSS